MWLFCYVLVVNVCMWRVLHSKRQNSLDKNDPLVSKLCDVLNWRVLKFLWPSWVSLDFLVQTKLQTKPNQTKNQPNPKDPPNPTQLNPKDPPYWTQSTQPNTRLSRYLITVRDHPPHPTPQTNRIQDYRRSYYSASKTTSSSLTFSWI